MDLFDNPMGTDGFEFVEYTAPDTKALGRLFEQMGFVVVAKHRSKNVLLYKQGDIQFIVNAEPIVSRSRLRACMGRRRARLAFALKMQQRHSNARSSLVRSRTKARSGQWS